VNIYEWLIEYINRNSKTHIARTWWHGDNTFIQINPKPESENAAKHCIHRNTTMKDIVYIFSDIGISEMSREDLRKIMINEENHDKFEGDIMDSIDPSWGDF